MDQMLKQRLIGAVVIISLAVIFIPMILEGPDDKLSPRNQSMPPPPTIDFQGEVALPVPAESTGAQQTPDQTVTEPEVSALPETPAAQSEPAASPPEAVKSAEAPKPAASREPPAQAPSRSAAAPALSGEGWVVQAGSFSQQSNAISLRDRLKKSGYQVRVQDAKSAAGRVYRVLVGPVDDRGAAEKLRDKLARDQRIKGMVSQNK
jgi:DedD protein